ncbi:hypothetical protein PF003_g1942 [Phytophthora fragariae]|nr:hypothetical protein PF003_g1942 [Phytophthora fragariae]
MDELYEATHTYQYSVRAGVEATARLDRWYVSAPMVDWVAAVETRRTGTSADHRAVRLHLRSPVDPVRVRKPAKVYPPPTNAADAVRERTLLLLQDFAAGLDDDPPDARKWARDWDLFKLAVRRETLAIIKRRRKTDRNSYKQRIRRLVKQDARLRERAAGVVDSVESITDALEVLTLTDGRGGTPLQRVRNAITDCTMGRASAQQRRLFRAGGHSSKKTTKAMFRRVSTKYSDNEIHRLDSAIGHSARGVHDKADTLADAWTPIFQQPASTSEERAAVLPWLGNHGQYTDLLADMTEPFTSAEVAAAVGASKPGKACGPDRLGNDWYRDFGDQLIPILTKLYNCWFTHGTFPDTFLEADIFCLRKGGDSSNPLNFRPLALLDTDYKILTRMMATRASLKLGTIIHPNQNGFVPFRTIHSTIDLYTAAQAAAQADPTMAKALALLLDFCKAYDSVDREFMYDVLRWLGCPADYVSALQALHDGTQVRFLANGYHSRWVKVTCGIRQGCPLAPLLFLFVLEALYRRIDADPRIHGILLKSEAGTVQLKIGGYADDSASYVRSEREVGFILAITGEFALASGLRINEGKTLVIALNPDAIPDIATLPAPLRVQPVTLSRYLGLPVGSVPDPEYTWQLARTQLITRLALATRKTMTVDQRSMVVAAVVIPKLLYIGRHQWPTTTLIASFQRMIHNFVWHARFSADAVGGAGWLNKQVAGLPRKDGGLAVPDLKLELLAHAAVTVNAWALEADQTMQIVGDVVAGAGTAATAQPLYITPRHTPRPTQTPRLTKSLWATGLTLCNVYGGVAAVTGKADMVVALGCLLLFRGPLGLQWRGRRLLIDASALRGSLWDTYTSTEYVQHGAFCTEWMPYLVLSDLRLYSETGKIINPRTRFWSICSVGAQLKDVLHWKGTHTNRLVATALGLRLTKTMQRHIGSLMQLLLLNFPQMMTPGSHNGDIRYCTRDEDHTPIRRGLNSARQLVTLSPALTPVSAEPPVSSHRSLMKVMQREVGPGTRITRVHPHPRLARMVCLWIGTRVWRTPRKAYKAQIGAKARIKGLADSAMRQNKWAASNAGAAAGLKELSWHRLRRIVGLNPWGEQLLLRIKLHAISTYNPVTAGMGCPHQGCERIGRVDLQHMFWDCVAARTLREVLLGRWTAAGLKLKSFEEAIFALALPTLPMTLTRLTGQYVATLPDAQAAALGGLVDQMLMNCWSIGAALYLLSVWRWRVAHFDALNDATTAYHTAGLRQRLYHGYTDAIRDYPTDIPPHIGARLSSIICGALGGGGDACPASPAGASPIYLILIAGTRGGTTRKCSSGTVILRLRPGFGTHRVVRVGYARYVGTTVTLSQSVHLGLLRGLRRCISNHWVPQPMSWGITRWLCGN